jgi:hypothetical protein
MRQNFSFKKQFFLAAAAQAHSSGRRAARDYRLWGGCFDSSQRSYCFRGKLLVRRDKSTQQVRSVFHILVGAPLGNHL